MHNVAQLPVSGTDEEKLENDGVLYFPVGLAFDNVGCGGEKTKGALVTNGRPGYLQFYDGRKDKQRMHVSRNFFVLFSGVSVGG